MVVVDNILDEIDPSKAIVQTEDNLFKPITFHMGGTLLLIPVNYSWTRCCNNFTQGAYHVFPNITITLPTLSSIRKITVIGGFTKVGNIIQETLPNDYLLFTQTDTNTTANYVSLTGVGNDDILWVKNNNTNRGIQFYCGNGLNSGIYICTFNGEADISYIFDTGTGSPNTVTLSVEASDYWGYNITGHLGYIAIDCSSTGVSFVRHPSTTCGYRYSKYYGWTGPSI